MADKREKQATCPICGYTDTALDADALQSAMDEHMRMTHNQVLSVNPDNSDMKHTGRVDGSDMLANPGIPAVPVVPPNNSPASNNIP